MNASTTLPYQLDRTVTIHAPPDTVFRFLTDSARWARWWGDGSTIDPRPGGKVYIRHANGVESAGEVVSVDAPRQLVFTYGFVSGTPIPAGSSRVTITLAPERAGTRLTLVHELAEADARDEHVQGWRFQLSLFANVVADEITADAARVADEWFAAWAEPDVAARRRALQLIVTPEIRVQDRFSNLEGIDDLLPHITASQRFMPDLRMRRRGAVRACQGMVLVDWEVTSTDGHPRATGTNVFVFSPGGRVEWVTGFWDSTA